MLLPSLASASDYEYWARSAGFRSIRHRDITTNVKATWDVCGRIVTQPNISGLLEKMPEHIRTFAGSFQAMKKAFDAGATNYVMLTARKPWLYLTPGDCGRAMIS